MLASSLVPDAVASDEVLAGVRDELAAYGALGRAPFPRCEIEVLRADEATEGIEATQAADGLRAPTSRATRVGLAGRAFWVARAGAEPTRDTGDVRAFELTAVASDARRSAFQHADATRAAGRRLGRKLGARLLGLPAATED